MALFKGDVLKLKAALDHLGYLPASYEHKLVDEWDHVVSEAYQNFQRVRGVYQSNVEKVIHSMQGLHTDLVDAIKYVEDKVDTIEVDIEAEAKKFKAELDGEKNLAQATESASAPAPTPAPVSKPVVAESNVAPADTKPTAPDTTVGTASVGATADHATDKPAVKDVFSVTTGTDSNKK